MINEFFNIEFYGDCLYVLLTLDFVHFFGLIFGEKLPTAK